MIDTSWHPASFFQYLKHPDLMVRYTLLGLVTVTGGYYDPTMLWLPLGIIAAYTAWQYYLYHVTYTIPTVSKTFNELLADLESQPAAPASSPVFYYNLVLDPDGCIRTYGDSVKLSAKTVEVESPNVRVRDNVPVDNVPVSIKHHDVDHNELEWEPVVAWDKRVTEFEQGVDTPSAFDKEVAEFVAILDKEVQALFDAEFDAEVVDDALPLPYMDIKTFQSYVDRLPDLPKKSPTQREVIFELLRDGAWWTLKGLSDRSGFSPGSVSSRIRDLRMPEFGGSIIERRYVSKGLYEYRLSAWVSPQGL